MEIIGWIFIGGLVITVSSVINGLTLSVLWGWFMVPTFGLPALGVAQAIGIAMVVSYMTYQHHNCKKDKDDNKLANLIAMVILRPLLALLVGAVIHAFM